jgi:MinD-like ATPase involved in chromosome partitioning or flagellar assembly
MAKTHDLDDLRDRILTNLRAEGIADARVHVAPNQFGGNNIRVVHQQFENVADAERQRRALQGITLTNSEVEVLTPDEEEWYGPAFLDGAENVPGWPEAMNNIDTEAFPQFASDLDQELDSPLIVTFYSLRGGVGRSTALAATARTLGARGHRVLCIDMDFEAPGLSYLLGTSEPANDTGALYMLLALERDEPVDIREHVQRISELDEVYCLPAGSLNKDYAERLRLLDPDSWYREAGNPLHKLLDLAAESSLNPDVIIIDSRTGMSPISAPLLFDASDLSVICLYPHPQTRRGTELLVKSLLRAKSRRSTETLTLTPEPRFVVSPIPAGPSATSVIARATEWIDEWMEDVNSSRAQTAPLRADELMHVISYSSEIAFRDVVLTPKGQDSNYGPIADWLEQLIPTASDIPKQAGPDKQRILGELDFSPGTAEFQDSFFDDYVRTKITSQAMEPRYPLVIGRKGTGKTAVFRWLLERSADGEQPIPVYCPNPFRDRIHWAIGADGFHQVEHELQSKRIWPAFWACYSALAAYLSNPRTMVRSDRFNIDYDKFHDSYGELEVVETLISMLQNSTPSLAATRWLLDINAARDTPAFMLFDGLDTGFGNDVDGRDRRGRAVTGLLTFLTENESRLPNLPFKVMLRFDIWQQLRFENKSHLFGRYVQLTWRDPNDYFKTALKQACRSEGFKQLVSGAGITDEVDEWSEEEVRLGWNLLVGERMKGGKTTFTRNWVWNRLSDGQGDHGPRALSQLFYEAVQWEKREETKNSYDRSIVRPRALVPSLDSVSDGALEALLEEFPELEPLVETLKALGRTPVDATDVQRANESALGEIDLALEVGLLSVYEGTQDDVKRYKVPDLYRVALGMTRRGQA